MIISFSGCRGREREGAGRAESLSRCGQVSEENSHIARVVKRKEDLPSMRTSVFENVVHANSVFDVRLESCFLSCVVMESVRCGLCRSSGAEELTSSDRCRHFMHLFLCLLGESLHASEPISRQQVGRVEVERKEELTLTLVFPEAFFFFLNIDFGSSSLLSFSIASEVASSFLRGGEMTGAIAAFFLRARA